MKRIASACAALLFLIAGSAAAQIRITSPRTDLSVRPGETTSLVFRVANESAAVWTGEPELSLPPGWRPLIPPPSLELASGESTVLILPIVIPRGAPASEYEATVAIGSNRPGRPQDLSAAPANDSDTREDATGERHAGDEDTPDPHAPGTGPMTTALWTANGHGQGGPTAANAPANPAAVGDRGYPATPTSEASGRTGDLPLATFGAVLSFRLAVVPVSALEVSHLQAPEFVLVEPYLTRFIVHNGGNVSEQVDLAVSDNGDYVLELSSPALTLAPGERREVTVAVTPPSRLTEPTLHTVTVSARTESWEGSASSRVYVLSSGQDPAAAYHTFGLELELRTGLDTRFPPDDAQGALREVIVSVRGEGRLRDGDEAELRLDLSNSLDLGQTENYVSYRHPDYTFSLGDGRAELTRLLPAQNGVGVDLEVHPREFGVGARVVLSAAPAGYLAGFGVRVRPAPWLLLGGQLSAAGSQAAASLTAAAGGAAADGVTASGHLELALDLVNGVPALDAELRESSHDYGFHVHFQFAPEGFLGAHEWRSLLSTHLRMRLVSGQPIWLNAGYSTTRTASSTRTWYGLGATGRSGDVDWSIGVNDRLRLENGERHHESDFRLAALTPLKDDLVLRSSVWWRSDYRSALDLDADFAGARLQLTFPLLGGEADAGVGGEFELGAGQVAKLQLGAGWAGNLAGLEFEFDSTARLIPSWRLDISASAEEELSNGMQLSGELSSTLEQDALPTLRAGFGVGMPVTLILGKKRDVGELSGRIVDGAGTGIPGLVVWLGGFTSITVSDGSFRFPAAPVGTHALVLKGLEPGLLTNPPQPLMIEISPRAGQEIEMEVLRAGSLTGSIVLDSRTSAGDPLSGVVVGSGSGGDTSSLLGGIELVASGPVRSHRLATGSDGEFSLAHLEPGEWELSIDESTLPEYHQSAQSSTRFTIIEGETATATFVIEPLEREIRFTGGGVLGSRP